MPDFMIKHAERLNLRIVHKIGSILRLIQYMQNKGSCFSHERIMVLRKPWRYKLFKSKLRNF